jgi:hypothetical protein
MSASRNEGGEDGLQQRIRNTAGMLAAGLMRWRRGALSRYAGSTMCCCKRKDNGAVDAKAACATRQALNGNDGQGGGSRRRRSRRKHCVMTRRRPLKKAGWDERRISAL